MKKKLLLIAIAIICIAILSSGSMAFFTSEKQARNMITTRAVDILVEEWQETANGLVPYPDNKPIVVLPSVKISKIATIKNLEADAFVRAKYDMALFDENGNKIDISLENLLKMVSVKLNSVDWARKDKDSEWWYYKGVVASGTSTQAFFTEVAFDGPNITNEYQNCTLKITVTAQAVQKANNGDNVFDAVGWPG